MPGTTHRDRFTKKNVIAAISPSMPPREFVRKIAYSTSPSRPSGTIFSPMNPRFSRMATSTGTMMTNASARSFGSLKMLIQRMRRLDAMPCPAHPWRCWNW